MNVWNYRDQEWWNIVVVLLVGEMLNRMYEMFDNVYLEYLSKPLYIIDTYITLYV